ncbi:hypothetical protein [Halalkalibacter sp. APA_J-10(15)]|uniref:hypothetical protein n=1 Tax=Halalkalibacter sp. APA_J-10(15) TaxID=2933805 RepID=UPI001FF13BE0|nr:hypothetical protein [Halalkalibacter sp. APA_J-10(15)]MCK0471428.1 hypothetical protein [Halalkalibacter sp. APA_J-10(15)]
MKTKPLQSFNRAEIALVIDCMKRYMFKVSVASGRLMLTDYTKILQNGNEAELDGMGMEHIVSALHAKANEIEDQLGTDRKEVELIRQLAQEVREKRVAFQQNFYKQHIKKEAPTAGTVSTSTNILLG